MDDDGFRLAWRAVSEDLRGQGRAALALDYSPGLWPSGLGTDEVLSLTPGEGG
jgi:hypothetical protein